VRDRSLCQGISVRSSGRLPSLRKRPEGSFMTGILAEANAREMMSLRAWCLVIRLGAVLHTKAWTPHVYTCDPLRQVCAAARRDPDRAVKPPPLELPHRQDGDHMRRLAVLTANHRCLTAMIVGCSDWVFPDEAKKQEEQAKQSISLPCHPL